MKFNVAFALVFLAGVVAAAPVSSSPMLIIAN